jgi:hypothetical protein
VQPEKPAPFVDESGQRRLNFNLLPKLPVMLLPVDRAALMIEPVLRLEALTRRECTAVDAITRNRAVNPGRVAFQAACFHARQLAAPDALRDAFLLMELAGLRGAAREGQPRSQRQRTRRY